jgi:hypothetical protein
MGRSPGSTVVQNLGNLHYASVQYTLFVKVQCWCASCIHTLLKLRGVAACLQSLAIPLALRVHCPNSGTEPPGLEALKCPDTFDYHDLTAMSSLKIVTISSAM